MSISLTEILEGFKGKRTLKSHECERGDHNLLRVVWYDQEVSYRKWSDKRAEIM
jgi:heme-degrading monooxygenase HmoA